MPDGNAYYKRVDSLDWISQSDSALLTPFYSDKMNGTKKAKKTTKNGKQNAKQKATKSAFLRADDYFNKDTRVT